MSSNEAIVALRAAGSALGDVDVSGWDETALTAQLAELSDALCHALVLRHSDNATYRRVLEESERARRYSLTFRVVLLDVDDQRGLNDRLGRAAGEAWRQRLG